MDHAHRVVVDYWAAANAKDRDAFVALVAADVVYEAPQTRERVRGRSAYRRFNLITRITDFWPTAAELPASRAHLVERYRRRSCREEWDAVGSASGAAGLGRAASAV